ncbi:MAG: CoA-acylating methylmalonate-semialdehyde dehydrogenase [Bifidobacteriaceae bacterium]|jgi:malonate-semialdehyde dehydrogenase (acetylating)/methylmalonate-semialdehyde dehydrogenase|nr:CoA-acylating methylmalonate-semialdehyde dehydrogenase [Bifidobacteriaceae bacterium]
MPTVSHWIDGRAVTDAPTATQPILNPATGVVIGRVALGDTPEVDAAVASATIAAEAWSQVSLSKRAQVLFRFRDLLAGAAEELAAMITRESGKTLDDAAGEVARGQEVVEYACGLPTLLKGEFSDQAATGIDVFSTREPLGVVAGITPFNFPVMVPLWMSPVAIAAGNAFILKPSERDPSPSLVLARLWHEAGLPNGVFNVVQGGRTAVDALLAHPGVAAVSFVGSTPVARHVHAAATATGKRVQALGGAKNHGVVLPDADLDDAANHLAAAAFGAAGERCMALSVALVAEPVADALVDKLAAKARAVKVAPGDTSGAQMGPVITLAAKARIEELVESAEEQGAHLVVDGRRLEVEGCPGGFFVGPTVIDGVDPSHRVYVEEVFGPVLCVVRVADLDAAINVINANPYGNGTAIFTGSGEAARRFRRSVHVGMIGVNVPIPVPVAWHSFGGWKDSLIGQSHIYGPEGFDFYTQAKVVTERWPHRGAKAGASYHFTADSEK